MQGRVAVITGATGGIGRAIAMDLAVRGVGVVVCFRKREDAAADVVSAVEAGGGRALAVPLDVADEGQVRALVDRTVAAFGKLDILVNNAGINRDGMCWKMPRETWHEVLEVNLTGPFLCTKHVVPVMRAQGWGRIVNVSSVVAQAGVAGTAAYSASKAGLIGLTKTTARELVRYGITVNCLALGYFDAGMMHTLAPALQAEIVKHIPAGRLGSAGEVARVVQFLCEEEAGYITGQLIGLNGGLYM